MRFVGIPEGRRAEAPEQDDEKKDAEEDRESGACSIIARLTDRYLGLRA